MDRFIISHYIARAFRIDCIIGRLLKRYIVHTSVLETFGLTAINLQCILL